LPVPNHSPLKLDWKFFVKEVMQVTPPPDHMPVSRMTSDSIADAAVAVAAALNVTEPSSCGLGGYFIHRSSAQNHAI
jgi:hypothetical protein